MPGKFEIKLAKDGEFHFQLKDDAGRILLASEMYRAKASAENGVASVRKNAAEERRFERKTSSRSEPYYVLKAANGEVIGQSHMYKTAESMEADLSAVRLLAPEAALEDLTK